MAIKAHPLGAFKNVRAIAFAAVLRRRIRLDLEACRRRIYARIEAP